ncbi:MAG: type IV pilus biogenesis/stability protein PilW [Methylophilus sp.]|nr:type IV pilus biogenesis/stability protein PilW [Methylophilus sp.]
MLFRWKFLAVALLLCTIAGCATQQPNNNPYNTETKATSRARAHTELGAGYFQQGKYAVALDEFNIAINTDPDFAPAFSGLGLVYAALGETAKADTAFQQALKIQPQSSESHNNYGNFLCNIGQYDASIKHFLEAVKNPLYETPHHAYTNAGICAMRKKDLASAETYLSKALAIQPLTYSAAYHLANLQFNRGDAKAAEKTLQNALVASPSPDVLWLGIKIARAVGNQDNEASYAILLRKQYPDSAEARMLMHNEK